MEEKKIIITFTGTETPMGARLCAQVDFEGKPHTDHLMVAVHSLVKAIAEKVGCDPYRVAAASIIAGEQAAMALEKRCIGWKK